MKRSDRDTLEPDFGGMHAKLLERLAVRRALTTRTLVRGFGPKPNWEVLLRQKHLIEVKTVYGPVVTFSRAMQKHLNLKPYITGPEALANRAYLNDALINLQVQKYELMDPEYKKDTAHITRYRMRVPPEQLAIAQRLAGNREPYAKHSDGTYTEGPGHPWLYARCSGGGIKLPMLKQLLQRHHHDLDAWWSPLIIAVPAEDGIREYLRAIDAAERRKADDLRNQQIYAAHYMPRPNVHLIVQPLPSLITRPSARH
jgi:hypothetical protein